MTPEQRDLIARLVIVPVGDPPIPHSEFLYRFGADDGVRLGVDLLSQAVRDESAEDVECSLIVGFSFGISPDSLDDLIRLAFADWHEMHEDVASALDDLRTPSTVGAFAHLAQWVPTYLDWDDAHALAVKAIWGPGNLRDQRATTVLRASWRPTIRS